MRDIKKAPDMPFPAVWGLLPLDYPLGSQKALRIEYASSRAPLHGTSHRYLHTQL